MKNDDRVGPSVPVLGRRNLMKLGAGVVVTTLTGANCRSEPERASPQERSESQEFTTEGPIIRPPFPMSQTGPGYKNDAGRASGNGPMDNTTRQIVRYVSSFSESNLTAPLVEALGHHMVDTVGCLISGFESEPARIAARMARLSQSSLKSTVLGYGITTSPEAAAFANTVMVRFRDFNDNGSGAPIPGVGGGHYSDMIAGVLAVGEALHSSGPEVLTAIAMGYELVGALQNADEDRSGDAGFDRLYHGFAAAMAMGKVLKLNEDQLANALSLSMVTYMPLRTSHIGALSHMKNCHRAANVRTSLFSAFLAREGMTGPALMFEGRDGLWDRVSGPYKELRLPVRTDGVLLAQTMRYKRFPTEGGSQAILEVIPQIREWTRVDDIASIQIEMGSLLEIADPPKWDPRNAETADHSLPYLIAVALIDGEVYFDAFKPERYLHDPAVRLLMEKIVCRNVGLSGKRIIVRTKTGGELTKEATDRKPMSQEEITAKFNRICAYMSVTDEQRDRTRAMWSNLQAVRDIAAPLATLANFGRPAPL